MKTLLSLFISLSLQASAAPGIALVIGVNDYPGLPSENQLFSPVNDATDVAAELRSLGFVVIECIQKKQTPVTKESIVAARDRFLAEAKGSPLAVVYFSGHGLQSGDENYLLPDGFQRISDQASLQKESIALRQDIMAEMETARIGTKIIILDCCRDNPFVKEPAVSPEGGTAPVKSLRTKGGTGEISGYGPGFFLAFATSPGTSALDGNGARNSPFTAAFLTHLKGMAGENIRDLFDEVKSTVLLKAGREQVPWVNDSLNKEHLKVLAPDSSTQRNSLVGTWVLESTTHPGNPPGIGIRQKIFTAKTWEVSQPGPDGQPLFNHGGNYSLKGDTYVEEFTHATAPTRHLIGQKMEFELTVEGDLLIQRGSKGTETWRKLPNGGRSETR